MTAAPSAVAEVLSVDGRTARAERTRAAIVDATIRLAEAGDIAPTARRIAGAAGVSERSLFLHFPDLEALHDAVAREHLGQALRRYRRVDPALALPERIGRFARQRAGLLERLTPLRLIAVRYEQESPALQASRRRWTALSRREIEATFGPELAERPDRPAALALVGALSSWAAWDELRRAQGLGVRRATAAMAAGLGSILGPPPP